MSRRRVSRSIRAAWVVVGVALALGAGNANATTLWDDDLVRLSDLQAGAEFDSEDGLFHFSDFDFDPIGFGASFLFDYLVAPKNNGFRLLLGFGGAPFGPDTTLGMTYKVTSNGPFGIAGAEIDRLILLGGGNPLGEVVWQGSNGATMMASESEAMPFVPVATVFAPVGSLMVMQSASLTGGEGPMKFETGYFVEPVPEPGTGLLLGAGIGAWIAVRRRSATER